MKDSCMICLSGCDTYIRLDICSCKIISHEKCFNEYTLAIKKIKCIICNRYITYDLRYLRDIDNTFLYTVFFFLQNLYFYIDDKFLYNCYLTVRLLFVVLYHCILMLILSIVSIVPHIIMYNIDKIYKSYKRLLDHKGYKVYNL